MIRQEITELLKGVIKDSGFKVLQVGVEHPENAEFGDYATNAALQIAKTVGMRPKEIADILKSKIQNSKPKIIERIGVVEPGFINFFISKEYLQNQVGLILKHQEKFGRLEVGKGQKVNIESISANPTGLLHIGNGRNAFSGNALANVMEKAGYNVTREYFINNAKNSKQIIELGKTALGKGEVYLSEYLKSKIKSQKFKIKIEDQKLTEGEVGFLLAKEVQADTQDFLEKKLKIKFDKWVSEQNDIYEKNKVEKILDWLKKNGLVYVKDKAIWLKTSSFGDEKDWVVVRETGEPTYLLSDMAYHKDKFDRGFNKVIDIWGADHQAHVSKMKAAAKILGFKGDFDILVLQLIALRGGQKMSKRAGNIITLEELVDEIGLDVACWFYLQKSLNTHTEIDLDLAKEQSEKNPVYYVQYAHARICSILQKANQHINATTVALICNPSELNLIKQLIKFPEIIEDTANDYQVQRLPKYATDLATAFHQFYRDCRVISEDKNLTQARLAVISAAKIILENTLSLMGISDPEKM